MANAKSIFSKDGIIDTRKVTNRNPDVIISGEMLERIENGITLEVLEAIPMEVFKYKTQITIHGKFPETSLICNNIFVNKNGSLGVRWNAIDSEKKNEIGSALRFYGWGVHKTSTKHYFFKNQSCTTGLEADAIIASYREIIKTINTDLFYGNVVITGLNYMGLIYIALELYVNAILEDNVWELLNGMGVYKTEIDVKKEVAIQEHLKMLEERRLETEANNKTLQELLSNNPDVEAYKKLEQVKLLTIFDVERLYIKCTSNVSSPTGLRFVAYKFSLPKGKKKYRFSVVYRNNLKDVLNAAFEYSEQVYSGKFTGRIV